MNATKIRKSFKFIAIFAILIVAVLFTTVIALNPVARVFASEGNLSDVVVMKHIPTIDDDFSGNRIIVTLQQQYSDINRSIELEDLGVDIEKAGLSISTERQSQINSLNQNEMINENIRDGRAIISNLFDTENKKTGISRTENLFQILSIELPIDSKQGVLDAIAELNKSEIIISAEPDYIYYVQEEWTPVDTLYSQQWGLTGMHGIKAEEAWDITRGNANVRVGVMEPNGVSNHEDLNLLRLDGQFYYYGS